VIGGVNVPNEENQSLLDRPIISQRIKTKIRPPIVNETIQASANQTIIFRNQTSSMIE
jgi:hypothetical protein